MILKLGMQHWGLKFYKVDINDDPWLTLTYVTAWPKLVTCIFEGFAVKYVKVNPGSPFMPTL